MKSTIMKINIMLLGCFLSVAIANAQGPSAIDNNSKQANTETKATTGKFTGHWFIKSGEEFYLVRSGNLPPGLVKKTTDNKVEEIDVEGVKRAVNFRKESNINGKPVDNYYFVIEEEGDGNSSISIPAAAEGNTGDNNSLVEKNQEIIKSDYKPTDAAYTLTYAYCGDGTPTGYKICAIAVCNGVVLSNGWTAINACSSGTANSVCLAFAVGYPATPPYYYYVICGTTTY